MRRGSGRPRYWRGTVAPMVTESSVERIGDALVLVVTALGLLAMAAGWIA